MDDDFIVLKGDEYTSFGNAVLKIINGAMRAGMEDHVVYSIIANVVADAVRLQDPEEGIERLCKLIRKRADMRNPLLQESLGDA